MIHDSHFWRKWLVAVYAVFFVFGLCLVVFPAATTQLFGLILFGDSQRIAGWDGAVVSYIQLIHAVLGAVIVAWAMIMLLIAIGWKSGRDTVNTHLLFISLMTWFVPDASYSLISGYWQNAVFNLAFVVPVNVGLLGLTKSSRKDHT